MSLENVIATNKAPSGLDDVLIDYLNAYDGEIGISDGVIYYGFPIFKNYEEQVVKTNFLLVSKKIGVVLFSTATPNTVNEKLESLNDTYNHVTSLLIKSNLLRTKNGRVQRNLVFDIDAKLYAEDPSAFTDDENIITNLPDLANFLSQREENLTDEHIFEIRSILEGAKALSKPTKRQAVAENSNNKVNILIKLEDEIINFDAEQRKAAITLINGPQRIRGLAGSGKTVILAMKVAAIHLQEPNKRILFTFYTKSLYNLIRAFISKFYRHFSGNEPNWQNIDVLHAWGGYKVDGVYFNAAVENHVHPYSLEQAKQHDEQDPFKFVCSELIKNPINSKYDYILIDEAQDLPDEFFRICYMLSKGESGQEKNIVWAYDDLQTIFNIYTRTPTDLFGKDPQGNPLINLNEFSRNLSWGQSNDLVLHKCYRNPIHVLVTAHALGFGLYDIPVQILEDINHWNDVGYNLISGNYVEGQKVCLRRNPENSPLSIVQDQTKQELIATMLAESLDKEVDFVFNEIVLFLKEGLKPEDIMVISLDDRNARSYFKRLSYLLSSSNIMSNNILASRIDNPPFIIENMITLTTVHRAKGNEASCVFVLGIDSLYHSKNTRRTRNKIFTAFTRTKAWLRVSGVGQTAQHFINEINQSLDKSPSLEFTVPNKAQLDLIHRDLGLKEQQRGEFREHINKLRLAGFSDVDIEEELQLMREGYDYD